MNLFIPGALAVLLALILPDLCLGAEQDDGQPQPTIFDQQLLDENSFCLTLNRLDTIYNYYAIGSATDRRERVSMFENVEFFQALVFNESDFRVRYKGSRIFTTIEDVVEYLALGNGDLNGGDIDVQHAGIESITCDSEDIAVVNINNTIFSDFEGGIVYNTNPDIHIFAPNSHQYMQVDTAVPDAVTNSIEGSPISVQGFCDAAILRCPGEFYPYASLQDCYETMGTMPLRCEEGVKSNYTGGVLQGDTVICRFLHLLSAGVRPTYHCPHLRNISVVCVPLECPSAVRLIAEAEDVPFNASHGTAIRILELIFVSLLLLIAISSFVWYSKARAQEITSTNIDRMKPVHPNNGKSHLPSMVFSNLKLCWIHDHEDDAEIVLDWDHGYLGGCKMTCMTGESGSGKTSLIKLLCGFEPEHMNLTCAQWSRRDPVAFCPQSADMWPREMIVKNILHFACALSNVNPDEYANCFDILGLNDLMGQAFGTLSGGQKQRVNIAATIVRPAPALIFLDEPFAALDENSALACLQVLVDLPVEHSFVMTVHNASPSLAALFDRIIHFDGREGHCMIERKKGPSSDPAALSLGGGQQVSWSKIGSMKASFILWYGQFYGLPFVELGAVLCSLSGAIIVGLLARKSTADWQSTFLPTAEGVRVPFYLADLLVGSAFVSSFGVSLIYANRERMLMKHFVTVRLMDPSAYLLTLLLFRSAVQGVLQSCCFNLVAIPLLGFPVSKLDVIFMNTAVFGFAWTSATFGASIMISSSFYSAHVIVIMDLLMVFFCGVFFYISRVYSIFKVLHYMNPLFYILSANTYVFGTHMLESGCGEKQHPGECATGTRILEMDDIAPFTSLTAQGVSVLFALIFFILALYSLYPKNQFPQHTAPTTGDEEPSADNEDFVDNSARPSLLGDSSRRQSLTGFRSTRRMGLSTLISPPVPKRGSTLEWTGVSRRNLALGLSSRKLVSSSPNAFENNRKDERYQNEHIDGGEEQEEEEELEDFLEEGAGNAVISQER